MLPLLEGISIMYLMVFRQKRHITLFDAVAIMVGNVIGSGIFLSPSGVTRNIGSVGGSLLVWAIMGLYNLIQVESLAQVW